MEDPDSVSIRTIAGEKNKPRYSETNLSNSPDPRTPVKDSGSPVKDSDSPNPIATPDDTPVRNETSGLVSRGTTRNLMNDFNELDVLREQLTQCQTDLERCEQSKFSNKLKKRFSCMRAGLKAKKSRKKKNTKKKTKRVKKTKPRRKTKKR